MTGELPFDIERLIEPCRQSGVVQIVLFGSMARGGANQQSNIDLVVKFFKPISLLQFTALERQISEALGRKVDLLTEAAIGPYLQEKIKRDLRVIYEA